MKITVNGVPILPEEIERELSRHVRATEPQRAAIEAVVLREVLRQEAAEKLAEAKALKQEAIIGMSDDVDAFIDETMVERLIEREVVKPALADEECLTYYRNHQEQFRQGDLVEVSHILFESEPNAVPPSLRQKAEQILQEALQHPEKFEELARKHSNCTSASVGGSLGQISHGETVPEFERVIFSLEPGIIASQLLESRFGLHIIRVAHRADGKILPFEMVREQLAAHLLEQKRKHALRVYLKGLVARADIQGVELAIS